MLRLCHREIRSPVPHRGLGQVLSAMRHAKSLDASIQNDHMHVCGNVLSISPRLFVCPSIARTS